MSKYDELRAESEPWLQKDWSDILSTLNTFTEIKSHTRIKNKDAIHMYYIGRHDALSYQHFRGLDVASAAYVYERKANEQLIKHVYPAIMKDVEKNAFHFYQRGYMDAIILLQTHIDPIPSIFVQHKPTGYTDPPRLSQHEIIAKIRDNPNL